MEKTLKRLTRDLIRAHSRRENPVQHFDKSPLPDKNIIYDIIQELKILLFPGYFGRGDLSFHSIDVQIAYSVAKIYESLKAQAFREAQHACKFPRHSCKHCHQYAHFVSESLLSNIPKIRDMLELDVKAAFKNDPAASGFDEIIFSYPGLEAISVHRLAHFLHHQGLILIPRIMNEWVHYRTGIDIHPGAQIGERFFIDHGTGVVIGETSVIGKGVTIYQGVTLGALNFPRDEQGNLIRGRKRHPTIEDGVVIYSGATILGDSVIGEGSVVGGNVWLTQSVPPFSRVILAQPELQISQKKTHRKPTPEAAG
jgi:serine O-acetyltransferase